MSDPIGKRPHVLVFAGPNGAGKTTAATPFLPSIGATEFVNADVIARGLSLFRPESMAMQAGRVMLERLRQLAEQRRTFAFETTLASRSFATWIGGLRAGGYAFYLFFYWLPSAEMAIERVAQRVRSGGHDIPEETVRRRYDGGLQNFFRLYRPLATHWRMYNNSSRTGPELIAFGGESTGTVVSDRDCWELLERTYGDEGPSEVD